MPKIAIKGTSFEYLESTVIQIVEGLIGLPHLKNAVLVDNPAFRPFHWLASIDDETTRFIVVDPEIIFPDFDKDAYLNAAGGLGVLDKDTVVLALVNVSSEWKKTTINLRAPILLNPHTKKAAQLILADGNFKLAESLTF